MPSAKDEQSKYQIDMINEMDIKYQKAMERKEGFELGEMKGREEGFELGEIKGREEGRKEKKFEIAANLKQNKVPIETIAICTGLTFEEISDL